MKIGTKCANLFVIIVIETAILDLVYRQFHKHAHTHKHTHTLTHTLAHEAFRHVVPTKAPLA